ncbi:MAG: FAD-dependent oxidoreductase [Thermodesulfobacteriota bacterium]
MNSRTDRYDAIMVGAGVGGLTVASLLAHEGWKVVLIEQADRVGGRAMTFRGEEIMDKGEEWYRTALGSQYTWLAKANPRFEEVRGRRLLEGYQLDVGYHGVALNGRGYFYDLDRIIGSGEQAGVEFVGNVNSTYIDNEWYLDFHAGKLDPRIKAIAKQTGLPFLDFYLAPLSMTREDYDRYERVSVAEWCRQKGIADNRVLFEMIHAVSTLITTINDPEEISIGDIWRYMGEILNPRFSKGIAKWPSGFVKGGIQRWMDSVANRFRAMSGELLLETRVREILISSGMVQGVVVGKDREKRMIRAPVVVSNIPTQDTFLHAPREAFPQDWVERTENLRGFGSIAPYFGLNKLVLPEDQWDKGVKDTVAIPKNNGLSHDVYMCWNIQSQSDPLCAPKGKHLLTAYAPVAQEEAKDRELMQWACDRILDYLEGRYPGFRDSIDWALFPVSWRLEGVAKDINQAGTLKSPVKAPGVEGLFFAGDTVRGYGVAMDCACAAGLICASKITGKDFGVT